MAGLSAPPAAPASILHAGGRPFLGPPASRSAAEDNAVVLCSDLASRHHARVYPAPDG